VLAAINIMAGKLAGVVTFTEVAGNGQIRALVTSQTCLPGYPCIPVGSGCDLVPAMEPDRVTVSYAQLSCVSAAQVGTALATHELWWHLFLAIQGLHCPTSNSFCGSQATSGAPNWEGVSGHTEAARWIYSVPAGSQLP
jgi:hypothetical protein